MATLDQILRTVLIWTKKVSEIGEKCQKFDGEIMGVQ